MELEFNRLNCFFFFDVCPIQSNEWIDSKQNFSINFGFGLKKKIQIDFSQTSLIQFCSDLNRSIWDSFGIALGLICKSQLKKTYW